MIVADTNTPSIRGVLKAGFVKLPGKILKNKKKQYVYIPEER